MELQHQVGYGYMACSLVSPLGQLQAGAGKNIAKTSVFPLLRIAETVKVKVPNRQRLR